jgi:hypothetical protein
LLNATAVVLESLPVPDSAIVERNDAVVALLSVALTLAVNAATRAAAALAESVALADSVIAAMVPPA